MFQTATATTTTHSLKRTLSTSHGTDAVPLPKIKGEVLLQYDDDNERLSELGERAFEMAVSFGLFSKRPMLTREEISAERTQIMSNEALFIQWVTGYKLRDRLRCTKEMYSSLTSAKETKDLFFAYVGGVFEEGGIGAIQSWVNGLLGFECPSDPPPQTVLQNKTPPPKKVKSESEDIFMASQPAASSPLPAPHYSQPQQYTPQQPHYTHQPPFFQSAFQQEQSYSRQRTPHMYTQAYPTPNPLAPAQPGLAFLPLFNQTATQRRVKVEYPAEFSGPSHAGQWSVQCVVNGLPKGFGTGGSKQVAKEEAARQAYYAMGWT